MIFFVANDGTIINGSPSPVYQGSANSNAIYLVAPFASGLTAAVAFQLPNGVAIPAVEMSYQASLPGIINQETGETYSGWTYNIPSDITQYYGTVTAQFYFYAENSGTVTATSATSFQVGKGVPAVLPPEPSIDVYEQILSNISSLQMQLNNGAFAARAIYAWNSAFTYGANEIVFYPGVGQFGSFVKSIVPINIYPPYNNGLLDTAHWQLVVDFDTISEAFFQSVQNAVSDAQSAAQEAENAATAIGKFAGKSILFVESLPDVGNSDYLYALVSESDPSIFELYGWDDGQWKPLGNADVVANVTRTYAGTLSAAGWAENKQTLFVPDLSASDSVQVSPADTYAETYIEDGVLATAVIDGGIVFTCASVPAADIKVNVCFTTQQVIPNAEGFYTKSEIAALAGGSTELTIDSNTFVITFTLKAIDGTVLSVNSVDLPLESVVVGGEYDEEAKAIVLTLQNGNTVSIPVGDLVDGLASQTALDAEIAARQSADSELGQRIDVIAERQPTSANITLAAVAWAANRQDVLVEGVTATNNIVVYPQDSSAANYVLSDINVTQADGKLVFTCATTPTADIAVVVDIA